MSSQDSAAAAASATKRGHDALATSLFKWKPDHLAAVGAFGDAGKAWRRVGNMQEYQAVMVARAASQHALGNDLGAGIDLEAAAKSMAPPMKSVDDASRKSACVSLEQAAQYFVMANKPDRAAECLLGAAKQKEALGDADGVGQLVSACLELYEGGDRATYAVDKGKRALAQLLKLRRYKDAMQCMNKLMGWFTALAQPHNVAKMAASRVILLLADGDVVLARREFGASLSSLDGFGMTNEAEASEALLVAMEQQDAVALTAAQASRTLTYLDNQVCRVAREALSVESAAGAAAVRVAPANPSQAAAAAPVAAASAVGSDPLGLGGVAIMAGGGMPPSADGPGGEEDQSNRAELFSVPLPPAPSAEAGQGAIVSPPSLSEAAPAGDHITSEEDLL